MNSHCRDKTILRPSYLHNGISYTGKMTSLYWIRALAFDSNKGLDELNKCLSVLGQMYIKGFLPSMIAFRSTKAKVGRCSNYIFILNLTPGFNGLSEDNCKGIQEPF